MTKVPVLLTAKSVNSFPEFNLSEQRFCSWSLNRLNLLIVVYLLNFSCWARWL